MIWNWNCAVLGVREFCRGHLGGKREYCVFWSADGLACEETIKDEGSKRDLRRKEFDNLIGDCVNLWGEHLGINQWLNAVAKHGIQSCCYIGYNDWKVTYAVEQGMRLIRSEVKLEITDIKLESTVPGRVPSEINCHALNTKISSTNISKNWRVTNVCIIELKVQWKLADLESRRVIPKLDYGCNGVDAGIKELELGDVEFHGQEVYQSQVLVDADVSWWSFIQGGNQWEDEVLWDVIEQTLEQGNLEGLWLQQLNLSIHWNKQEWNQLKHFHLSIILI